MNSEVEDLLADLGGLREVAQATGKHQDAAEIGKQQAELLSAFKELFAACNRAMPFDQWKDNGCQF